MISWLTIFSGRLHPLLVHLPIGILFLSFTFECLALIPRYKKMKVAIQPTLFMGAVFAVMAAISGYFLSGEGGYEDDLLETHQYLGIATAAFSIILFGIRKSKFIKRKPQPQKNYFRIALSGVLLLLLTLTGHFGGSLTHGEEFLSLEENTQSLKLVSLNLSYDAEAVYYTQVVQPILETKCYSCHSSKKQKGQLRLDDVEYIQKGGKHGKVINGTIADSSSLYSRLLLPPDHDEHMPPNEKPQLSSAEISLIQVWLEEGAHFDTKIKQLVQQDKVKQYIEMLQVNHMSNELIPEAEIQPADEGIILSLRKQNVIVLPVSSESNYVTISFLNVKTITDEQVQWVVKLKDQAVQLVLAFTVTNDEQLDLIRNLNNLRQLDLRNTSITDKTIKNIRSLKELRQLNLINTNLTDEGLKGLVDLKNLNKIFLYNTQVTREGITWLSSQLPKAQIDTGGYKLPQLATDTIIARRIF